MHWIVTDNIYRETWRRLLEYANVELTVDQIENRHGPANDKSLKANYVKQAEQVRVSILQAKEYFEAASQSSLFTSPNHLYYGMVAIASAMMLVLGDGTRSLDFLRRNPKNSHHGLVFSTASTSGDCSTGLALLAKTHAEITQFGHFANWYSTLPNRGTNLGLFEHIQEGSKRTSLMVIGGYDTTPIEQLIGVKKSIIDVMKSFPDLQRDLARYGVGVPFSRSSHTQVLQNGQMSDTWLIHGARSPADLEEILNHFSCSSRHISNFTANFEPNAIGGIVRFVHPTNEPFKISWPTTRETLDNTSISFGIELNTLEIVDSYLVGYQLSMLSRYFPDLWISCLESHCKASKLIEQAVGVLLKKFPLLALSLLTPNGLVISTHRESW